MAQRAVQRNPSVVDPMFFIPDGADEFVYSEALVPMDEGLEPIAEEEYLGEMGDDYSGDAEDSTDFEDYSDVPDTPTILGVVSQTVRRTPDGSQVVDLIIEVDNIPGISNYEIRVTKAAAGQVI